MFDLRASLFFKTIFYIFACFYIGKAYFKKLNRKILDLGNSEM